MRYINDSGISISVALYAICAFFLCIGAFVGVNSWPGYAFYGVVNDATLHGFVNVFSGYSWLLIMFFWGSGPLPLARRCVFFLWPVITFLLWLGLRNDVSIGWFPGADLEMLTLMGVGMAIPAQAALLLRAAFPSRDSNEQVESSIRWILLILFLFVLVPRSALDLTVSLHPQTYDLFALKIDDSAGLNLTPWIVASVEHVPGLKELISIAYGLTPLAFMALVVLQLRGRAVHLPNAILLWVLLSFFALAAYHFFPITGPKYIFGSEGYVEQLINSKSLPLDLVAGALAPRNGMPSMHFGWMFAVVVVWFLSDTRILSRCILVLMALCVALATLYLGEHYTIDLIVAAPFVLAVIAIASTNLPWVESGRGQIAVLGFGCWLTWIIFMRGQPELLISHPLICWILIIATAGIVWKQINILISFRDRVLVEESLEPVGDVEASAKKLVLRMGLMFFASGVAALIYQVLFAKELALVFGSTATATFTVLATFLGGMAIGSLVGGFIAARVKRLVLIYAFIEFAIGVFCIATPVLFSFIQDAYVYLASGMAPDAVSLLVLRVALGAGVLLVPTVLMGVTLPLLAQALSPESQKLGRSVALLYACNTAGAAVGALLTSYIIIPVLGVHSTTLLAALLNLLVALGAIELSKTMPEVFSRTTPVSDSDHSPISFAGRRNLIVAWSVLGFGGLLSLGLEVVYVHLLSIVAGNSVYAFGLMLATFLVGLALGGECGRRLIADFNVDRVRCLVVVQLMLASAVALSCWGWNSIPEYFASYSGFPLVTSFGAREMIRGLVCALIMVPPTIFIGLSYTVAIDLATSVKRENVKILGISAALNTLGNIIGVLFFGFFLLPRVGGLVASKIVAGIALAIAIFVIFFVVRERQRLVLIFATVLVASLLAITPGHLNYALLSSGANVYFMKQQWGEIIDHAESVDGGLTAVAVSGEENAPIKTLLTNGKFQGNNARQGEVQAQVGFAALSLLHQPLRESALVIGYGTGVTSRVFLDAGFAHLDIAELSRDVVRLADENFSEINLTVSKQPKVTTHFTDGRNLLLLASRKYNVVSIEITSIWFAGAASLYNREFYKLAKSRMYSDGVLQQWVQLHHMAPTDLLTIIGTLRSEFSYVSLYVVGGQGILIATNDVKNSVPQDDVLRELDSDQALEGVRELAGRKLSEIAQELYLSPSEVDVLVDEVGLDRSLWVSTDNNLRLEYNTPKGNAPSEGYSADENIKFLQSARRNH